jgi:hypothetical protein
VPKERVPLSIGEDGTRVVAVTAAARGENNDLGARGPKHLEFGANLGRGVMRFVVKQYGNKTADR